VSSHVVAEPREFEVLGGIPPGGGARPAGDLGDHGGVGDVAHNCLAGDVEAAEDVAVLAIAVRSLVEVHEVEVDVVPRQGNVRLGVQVQ